MVPVDVAVGGELPVRAVEHGLDRVAVELFEAQHRQCILHPGHPLTGSKSRSWVRTASTTPAQLVGRQLDQAVHVELAERVLARNADQLAHGVVHPRVVGARETACVPTARGDLRSTVAADVEERSGHAVLAPYDEDRTIGDLQRVVVARLAQVARQRHDEW